MRINAYLPSEMLAALDHLARVRHRSRSQIIADAVQRYADQVDVLDRLDRIEALLAAGARATTEEIPPHTDAAAETLANLRAWASPDDD